MTRGRVRGGVTMTMAKVEVEVEVEVKVEVKVEVRVHLKKRVNNAEQKMTNHLLNVRLVWHTSLDS